MKTLKNVLTAAVLSITAVSAHASIITPATSDVQFPSFEKSSYLKQIPKVELDQIIHLKEGMNKDSIRSLFGNPQFNEGMIFNKSWNYVLDIRKPGTDDYARCQVRIDFDKKIATAIHWTGEENCFDLKEQEPVTIINNVINPPPMVTVQEPTSPPPAPEVLNKRFTVNADALFGFNKSGLTDMKVQGRKNLDQIASQLKKLGEQGVSQVVLTGHTDHFGSEDYNMNLSIKRANTVRDYLISQGVGADALTAIGAGETQPNVTCDTKVSKAEQIACLQPNRRVDIDVSVMMAK